MNKVNPQDTQLNIYSIKKRIEFQNLKFNQKQLQKKAQHLRLHRQREHQQQSLLNDRALLILQQQRQKQIRKKFVIQDILQGQYDQQINVKSRLRTEQKSQDILHAQLHKKLLDNYEKSRIYDLGKIYHISNKKPKQGFSHRKIATEGNTDSLDWLKQNGKKQDNLNLYRGQSQNKLDRRANENAYVPQYQKQCFIENPINKTINITRPSQQKLPTLASTAFVPLKKYSQYNLEYSSYLKRQIQRKQQQKYIKKQNDLIKQRQDIKHMSKVHQDILQNLQYQKNKKKYQLSSGLDRQIKDKQKIHNLQRFSTNVLYKF